MKLVWFLAILAVSVSASDFDEDNGRINGETGWYVPQIDGSFVWMDLAEAEEMMSRLEEENNRALSSTVEFYLYTRSNPTSGVKITDSFSSIQNTFFNPANPTRFIIHGWTQSFMSGMNEEIRDAWLSLGDFNIIVVDWSRARSVDYASSVVAIPSVGKKVAGMVDFLAQYFGMSLNTLHVIGHSLGAHVAGHTGKNVQSGRVHTIVGLDPALPLFRYSKPEKRLSSEDAFYVESIQTNGGKLGFLKPIGKGAFYPNGGKKQPGCSTDVSGACSHGRSCIYYAEATANNNYPTIRCNYYEAAVNNQCGATYSSVRMGSQSNAFVVNGYYYVPVRSYAPYGMGQ